MTKASQSGAHPPADALYVHVPFCRAKCRYCDFYSLVADDATGARFVAAALVELSLHRSHLRLPLSTVFIGGGTPTSLAHHQLQRLLAAVGGLCDKHTEFTVEANPGTVDRDGAKLLRACGVNRVSLGVQSFEPKELALLGRIHSAEDARVAITTLRSAGITNLSIDLIYAIPSQTPGTWRASLKQALDLGIDHLSCYALSFEPGTPLYRDLTAGLLAEMDDSLQRELYQIAIEAASRRGLAHYEISNFARSGRQCRQNLTYWHNKPYLGIGPAAASYIDATRRTNESDLTRYLEAIAAGVEPPCQSERLGRRATMGETLMLGLRLIEGVDRNEFQQRFGLDPIQAFPRSIDRYCRQGALIVTDDFIRIAPDALFVADTVLADIVAEASGQQVSSQ